MKNNKKEAQEWFARAESDFQYAKAGEKETRQHHITCFLCHQSVEKALKAALVFSKEVPQKTHHLGFLISKIITLFPQFISLHTEIRRLDKFYIPARYPDGSISEFTDQDARKSLEVAEKTLELARTIILSE